jgi:hypothetical protein
MQLHFGGSYVINHGNIQELISKRAETHGSWPMTAHVAQAIKAAIHNTPNWETMSSSEREGLDMIAQKLARILTGDHMADEHWEDIIGYTEMIRRELSKDNIKSEPPSIKTRIAALNAVQEALDAPVR